MLRLRRLTQLLMALCASAFLSALISLIVYRFLSMTAKPTQSIELTNGIQEIQDIERLRGFTLDLIRSGIDLRDGGATLASWGLGFVLIWSSILGLIAFVTYRQACKVLVNPDLPATENSIDKAFSGKLELAKIFWGGYVTLSLLLVLISNAVFKLLPSINANESSFLLNALVAPIVLAIPAIFYWTCAILVWRCAANTSSIVWRYLAKLIVIIATILPLIEGAYLLQSILL